MAHPVNLKKAALRLAMLSSSDRNWLLSRLTGADRQALDLQLEALSRFPVGLLYALKADVERLLNLPAATAGVRTNPALASRRMLDRAHVDDLLKVLRELPLEGAGLVASRALPETGATITGSLRPRDLHIGRPDAPLIAVSDAFVDLLVEVVEEALEARAARGSRAGATA